MIRSILRALCYSYSDRLILSKAVSMLACENRRAARTAAREGDLDRINRLADDQRRILALQAELPR